MVPLSKRASLAVGFPNPYVYRSPLKRLAAHGLDACGDLLFGFEDLEAIPWPHVRRVAVLRLDHLGDVLHCLPALRALKRALPNASVDLFVGPWGKDIAEMAGIVDRIQVFDAPWFWRPVRREWPWKAIQSLARLLAQGGYDVGLEMRGDLRHHLALWKAGIPWRAGQAITAGRFLLNHPVQYRPGLHEIEQNLSLLKQLGLAVPEHVDRAYPIAPARQDVAEAKAVWKKLKLGRKVVGIQAACGTAAKRWQAQRWAEVIDLLSARGAQCVILGAKNEVEEMQSLRALCHKKPCLATGLLRIQGLAAFLKQCRLLISVDSGPAHLAAAVGTPVVALYSGTNLAQQWGPRGKNVEILSFQPECSPCELATCPFNNECMGHIEVRAVVEKAMKFLK